MVECRSRLAGEAGRQACEVQGGACGAAVQCWPCSNRGPPAERRTRAPVGAVGASPCVRSALVQGWASRSARAPPPRTCGSRPSRCRTASSWPRSASRPRTWQVLLWRAGSAGALGCGGRAPAKRELLPGGTDAGLNMRAWSAAALTATGTPGCAASVGWGTCWGGACQGGWPRPRDPAQPARQPPTSSRAQHKPCASRTPRRHPG